MHTDITPALGSAALPRLPHHGLLVYQKALLFVVMAKGIADELPRGHGALRDQLLRAATSTALNIGEGANRRTAKEKRHSYAVARAECGEAAVAAEIAALLALADEEKVRALMTLAKELIRMLSGLCRS